MTTLTYSTIIGALNVWFLVLFLPNSRRYFSTASESGYIHLSKDNVGTFLLFLTQKRGKISLWFWIAASICTFSQKFTLVASVFLLAICHYYFIFHRYSGVGRGIGAPGYFITWANFTNFAYILIETFYPSSLDLLSKLLLVELGFIFLVSGIYKITAGYISGQGMNIGLNNPQWAYFPNLFQKLTEHSFITKLLNYISVYGEILGGVLLISIKFQMVGAIIIAFMFLGVSLLVRLGNLCSIIIVTVLAPNFIVSSGLSEGAHLGASFTNFFLLSCLILSLAIYIAINLNFYFRLRFPKKVQSGINFLVRLLGTSMWRVFTADITSIYIEIYEISDGIKRQISTWDRWKPSRFRFVGEAIAVTSIFTLLKYTQDRSLFESRILDYSRTLDTVNNEIYFDYFHIEEIGGQISRRSVCTYRVSKDTGQVFEKKNDSQFDFSSQIQKSKLYKTNSYGNYS
jgi:hypothetical protein